MNRSQSPILVLGSLGALALGAYLLVPRQPKSPAMAFEEARAKNDELGLIKELESSTVKGAQDAVAKAKMSLGYEAAKEKDFKKARTLMLAAATEFKGEPIQDYTWGSVPDQAKVQAAICLIADGKPEEGRRELLKFIEENPMSPLIYHAYKRVMRLNKQVPNPEEEKIFQAAKDKQDEDIKRRTADCGPKVIARLIDDGTDIEVLRKECQTDIHGTTAANLSAALEKRGFKAQGMEVNAPDFRALKTPFVWLNTGHYVLVESIKGNQFTFFDPFRDRVVLQDLPATNDPHFRAIVLKLQEQK